MPQQAQGFDVNAARRAGYSDDDILQELSQRVKFDVQGALNAGHSKAEIIDNLSGPPPEQKGLLRRTWEAINTPVADFVLPKDVKTGDLIKAAIWEKAGLGQYIPGMNDEHTVAEQNLGKSPTKAAIRTFLSGAIRDTANVAASFTSPMGLALTAGGVAAKAGGAIGKLARAGQTAAGVGFGAQGAADVYEAGLETTPEAWQKRLQGGAMLAGGTAGAISAAYPAARAVATRTGEALQESAVKQYGQALNPTKERTKFLAQKRIPEMLERGITAKSPRALAERATEEAGAATTKLNDIYESLPADRSSKTAPMLQALEDYKSQFQDRLPMTEEQFRAEVAANRGAAPANIEKMPDGSLVKVVNIDDNAINAANSMQSVIKQYGETISPQSMRKVRQIFDQSVAKAGGYEGKSLAEGSILDAKREAASAIREQLAKDNPELVPLNSEINFWLDVQRIASETAKRRVGQEGGLGAKIARTTGGTVGGYVGYQTGGAPGAAVGAYIGGALASKLARATQSTGWRTVSAVTKSRLANALANGDMKGATLQLDFIDKRYTGSLPPVSGGSPTAGTASGAAQDTAFFAQARQEMPNASVSDQLLRAQQLKTQAASAGEDFIEQVRRGGFEPTGEESAYPLNMVPKERRPSTTIPQAENAKIGERIAGRSQTKQAIESGKETAKEKLRKLKRDPKTGKLIKE